MSTVPEPVAAGWPQRPEPLPPGLELVLERVRCRAQLRAAWLRALWAAEGEPGGRFAVTHGEADALMAERDAPEAEGIWIAAEARLAPLRDRLAEVEGRLSRGECPALSECERVFGLESEESDLLQACLATAVNPGLGRVYAYLQDQAGRGYVTEELVARLFGHGRCGAWGPESALFRWELIVEREIAPGEPPMLACDPHIRGWFLGRRELDRALVDVSRLQPTHPALPGWPVEELVAFLDRNVNGKPQERVRVTVTGPPGSGRRTLAAVVAARLRLPLLVIDADAVEEPEWRRVFLRAQRQGYLDRCALAWTGDTLGRRSWPQAVPPFPLQFVITEPGQQLPPVETMVELTVEMPPLESGARLALWREYVPQSQAWPADVLETLSARHRVTVGDIVRVARRGVGSAAEAVQAVRETARGRLGPLAQLLECPFDWDDLVVADHVREALEDLAFEAGARPRFWEDRRARRLFPQGRGLVALLAGSPGTGKTMAAQIIAARLGLDLYRIDLSAVVSKYVGETSQNIERLLRRAATMDVVLLFDEADAIYGKRTTEVRDAQDRFANMDTSHLMVAIESYSGVVLLATNLKSNIDPAFLRRIRYVVDFPKPDAQQRLQIWRKVVGALTSPERLAALDGDVSLLAESLETTGSQIKFALLAGLFIAEREDRPLAMPHLLRGLNRELAKEGRALSDREKARLLEHGR